MMFMAAAAAVAVVAKSRKGDEVELGGYEKECIGDEVV